MLVEKILVDSLLCVFDKNGLLLGPWLATNVLGDSAEGGNRELIRGLVGCGGGGLLIGLVGAFLEALSRD